MRRSFVELDEITTSANVGASLAVPLVGGGMIRKTVPAAQFTDILTKAKDDRRKRRKKQQAEGVPEVRVVERQRIERDWICPHCDEVIREKALFHDVKTGKDYHRGCADPIILPMSEAEEWMEVAERPDGPGILTEGHSIPKKKISSRVSRQCTVPFEVRSEEWDDSEYGGSGNLPMESAYSIPGGQWIGNVKEARFLCCKKGIQPEFKHADSNVCSVGFREADQKWYGWSHRAICGFGIGDMIFEERFGDDSTPFIKHGKRPIKTLDDARLAASRFADSVG